MSASSRSPFRSPAGVLARRAALGAAVAAGVLALAGCGSGDHDMASMAPAASSAAGAAPSVVAGTPASGPHNDADVAFATGMIPHHAQAIQMAELAVQRSASPAVKELAAEVKAAQGPEISVLAGWLTGWGEPVPATDGSMAMDHGAGGHGDMQGMMTEEQMAELAAAQGKDFDTRWLQMMIEHHEGAVSMAQAQQAAGSNADAKKLAQTIMTTQAAEITTMKGLQASLS